MFWIRARNSLARWSREHADVLMCVLLFGISVWFFHPGLMTEDSVTQLTQAESGVLDDWHPPLMSGLWRVLNQVSFGPAPMLVFQNLLFFAALALLLRRLRRPLAWRCAAGLAFCLVPAVFTQLGVIWKDVGMSCSFFLACALLLWTPGRRWLILPALALLFYGAGVRYNAFTALPPLCLWMAWMIDPAKGRRFLAAAAAFFLIVVGGASLATSALRSGAPTYPGSMLCFYDLAGISLRTRQAVYPQTLCYSPVTLDEIGRWYNTTFAYSPVCFNPKKSDPGFMPALMRAWARQMARHPAAYLGHRLAVFETSLNIGLKDLPLALCYWIVKNKWAIEKTPNALYNDYWAWGYKYRNAWFLRAYPYMLLGLITLLWAAWTRHRAALAISASGLAYGLAYFFLSVGSDLRYYYWTIFASGIALLLLFGAAPSKDASHVERRTP